jgi:hypothetical protein
MNMANIIWNNDGFMVETSMRVYDKFAESMTVVPWPRLDSEAHPMTAPSAYQQEPSTAGCMGFFDPDAAGNKNPGVGPGSRSHPVSVLLSSACVAC